MPFAPAPWPPIYPDPPFPTSTAGCWRLGGELYSDFRPYQRSLTDLMRARAQVPPEIEKLNARVDKLGGDTTEAGMELQRKNAKLICRNNRINYKLAEYARLRDRLRALSIHMRVEGLVRQGGKDVPTFPLNM
mgnify:FL=1